MRWIQIGCLGICLLACKTTVTSSSVKLVGGQQAESNDFPSTFIWTTQNAELKSSYCTGAKVGEHWILTAAHCVLEQNPRTGETYLGPWVLTGDMVAGKKLRYSFSRTIDGSHREELIKIVALVLPPMVEACVSDPKQNPDLCQYRSPIPDAALIKVSPSQTSSFRAAPIAAIDTNVVHPLDKVFIMGYGSEEEDYRGPPRLKFSPATVSTPEDLRLALEGTYAAEDGFPDWMYYFGIASDPTQQEHKNLGFGDSGGPVYRKESGAIVGINSDGFCPIGNRSCSSGTNSTFTRIDHEGMHAVASWLIEHLAP